MNTLQEIKSKSVKGVVSYGVRTLLLHGVAVIATGMLGVFLDPEEFGVYFVVVAMVALFTFLSDVGLAAALIQKKEEPTLDEYRTTFTVQQLLAILIFGIITLLTPVWEEYNSLDQYGLELVYALGFSFVLASLKTIPSIMMERRLEFERLVIPQMFEQVVFYGLAVWLAYEGYGIRSFTYAVIARSIIGVVVIYLLQQWKIGLAFSHDAFSQLISFGLRFQANDLLARLKDDLFVVVLGWFLSPAALGLLGWAKRWSMFPYQFSVQNVIAITFPTYSRLQHDKQTLKKAVEMSIYFISLIIFPVLVGIIVLAHPLTELIPAYAKWQPALPMLYLYCINIGFAAVANPLINTLNAIGSISITLKLMMAMTAATWLLTPLFYQWYGVVGVAVVAALVAGISLYAYVPMSKIVPVRILSNVSGQLVASLLMGILLYIGADIWRANWLWFGSSVIVGGIVYLTVIVGIERQKLFENLQKLFKTTK